MKVGIIRCQLTEDMCPGSTCLKVVKNSKLAFAEYNDVEVIGFLSCGGCSGKKVIPRISMFIERGADAIAFASCMRKGNPIGFPCPHYQEISRVTTKTFEEKIKIIDWTH